MFTQMTSNNFLNSFGNPTRVEAKIGLIFNNEGLEKAFSHIEKSILPLFLQQEKKTNPTSGWQALMFVLKRNWMPHITWPRVGRSFNRPFRPPTLAIITGIKS